MKTQAFTVRLPADLHEQLRREAFESRTTQNGIVIEAIQEHLATLWSERRDKTASGTGET